MKAWKRKAAHRQRQKKTKPELLFKREYEELKKNFDSAVCCVQYLNGEIEESHNRFMKLSRIIDAMSVRERAYQFAVLVLTLGIVIDAAIGR